MKHIYLVTALVLSCSPTIRAHEIGHEHEHVEGGWNAKAGFVSDTDMTARLYNTRGKSHEEIVKRAMWLAEQYDLKRTPEQIARAAAARGKYADAIAINSILPASVGIIGNTYESFSRGVKRNQDAGMTLPSATVYAFPAAIPEGTTTYDVIAASDEVLRDQGMVKVNVTNDIRKAKAEGKIAIMYNTQGADYVADDLKFHADKSYEHGIRTMNFTYNNNNALAGGGAKQDLGLTEKVLSRTRSG